MTRDLSNFSKEELLAELARREQVPRERHTRRRMYCDECIHFATSKSKCLLGKENLRFRVPADYDEAERGDWGFYKVHCRPVTSPAALQIVANGVRGGVPIVAIQCLCGARFEHAHAIEQVRCECGRLAWTTDLTKAYRANPEQQERLADATGSLSGAANGATSDTPHQRRPGRGAGSPES